MYQTHVNIAVLLQQVSFVAFNKL